MSGFREMLTDALLLKRRVVIPDGITRAEHFRAVLTFPKAYAKMRATMEKPPHQLVQDYFDGLIELANMRRDILVEKLELLEKYSNIDVRAFRTDEFVQEYCTVLERSKPVYRLFKIAIVSSLRELEDFSAKYYKHFLTIHERSIVKRWISFLNQIDPLVTSFLDSIDSEIILLDKLAEQTRKDREKQMFESSSAIFADLHRFVKKAVTDDIIFAANAGSVGSDLVDELIDPDFPDKDKLWIFSVLKYLQGAAAMGTTFASFEVPENETLDWFLVVGALGTFAVFALWGFSVQRIESKLNDLLDVLTSDMLEAKDMDFAEKTDH